MTKNKKPLALLVGIVITIGIILIIVAFFSALFGIGYEDGCMKRYSFEENGIIDTNSDGIPDANKLQNKSIITHEFVLRADGNYSNNKTDPNSYGQWLDTEKTIKGGENLVLNVKGEVSLCLADLPTDNLGSIRNIDSSNRKIKIPRIDKTTPLSIADTRSENLSTPPQWLNLLKVYKNDKYVITVELSNNLANHQYFDVFTNQTKVTDCFNGNGHKTKFSPWCGKMNFWQGKEHVTACRKESKGTYSEAHNSWLDAHAWVRELAMKEKEYTRRAKACPNKDFYVGAPPFFVNQHRGGRTTGDITCPKPDYKNVADINIGPLPYRNDRIFTDSDDINPNYKTQCSIADYINNYSNYSSKFWITSNNLKGYIHKFSSQSNPKVLTKENNGSRTVLSGVYTQDSPNYIQIKPNTDSETISGGFVFGLQQTACRRVNGEDFSDSFPNRGRIQYKLQNIAKGQSFDDAPIYEVSPSDNGKISITTPQNGRYRIYLRIENNNIDYKDSTGEYQISMDIETSWEGIIGLDRLFQSIKEVLSDASTKIFKKITCHGNIDNANCTNYFNYIRGILTLYIAIYGLAFLAGVVKISQMDLVIRVVKISIVAGLISEKTLGIFTDEVMPFVLNFSEDILSSMSGYSKFTNGGISNPFSFAETVLAKILLSPLFKAQLLAMMAMGITGVGYLILMIIAIGILVISLMKAMVVFISAMIALTVLMALAPIFLTFMLFETTQYLFDNWVRFTIRYMIEPLILLAGIIILTQLFTIFLDFTVGYSVCFKCAMPIKLPFLGKDFPTLLCIYWFAPWGYDPSTDEMGMHLYLIASLLFISYAMYTYVEFSFKISMKIVGGIGGPSSINMGVAGFNATPIGRQVQAFEARSKAAIEGRMPSQEKLEDEFSSGKKSEGKIKRKTSNPEKVKDKSSSAVKGGSGANIK